MFDLLQVEKHLEQQLDLDLLGLAVVGLQEDQLDVLVAGLLTEVPSVGVPGWGKSVLDVDQFQVRVQRCGSD